MLKVEPAGQRGRKGQHISFRHHRGDTFFEDSPVRIHDIARYRSIYKPAYVLYIELAVILDH